VIDIHDHILPGLDHGSRDWDETLQMCRIAAADGITTLAATPHVNEIYHNTPEEIRAAVRQLRERLEEAGVEMEIAAGGDYHIHPDLGPENIVTLNDNGRYFLLEFPYHVIPPNSEAFTAGLINKGLIPIITHPERISSLHRDYRRLELFLKTGALVQITAGSLAGDFGPEVASCAEKILKKHWVHFLATDAHWVEERTPVLSEGLKAAARIIGEVEARALVDDNPRAALEGKSLHSSVV
jgi:protein-tyrosine phosphatase